MKKLILTLIFALFICTNIYAGEIVQPKIAAQGAVLMDAKTSRVLWERNSQMPLAMASTTKIMTAIIALENGNLADTVTVSKRAASAPEVNMNLVSGEKLTLEALLYALMLQSHNDSAVAIAEHVGGNVENFCAKMTEKAKELGALDTVFETPNGLDAGNHHSTAYDMALITRYALQNEKFMDIINTAQITVHSDRRTFDLYNKNRLLSEYSGANGVKTGFTGKAGQCFIGAAQRDGMQLISVVLASGWGDAGKEQKWIDTKHLLDYGFGNYKYIDLLTEGDICSNINIAHTKFPLVAVALEKGLTLPLNTDEMATVKIQYKIPDTVMAPVEKGQIMGVCTVTMGDELIANINLLAQSSSPRHDLATSLKKILREWTQMGTNGEIPMENFLFSDWQKQY